MVDKRVDGEFNTEQEQGRIKEAFLDELISNHTKKLAPKYKKYQRLYENKHRIQNKKSADVNKPNNKISNDFFGQIIDNTVGYFLGNPIIFNYTEPKKDKALVETEPVDVGVDLSQIEDTAIQEALDNILADNEKDDIFMEWGKEAMIKGLSHILVYQNEESKTKFMRLSPEDVILVYKNSSTKELQYGIRLYDIDTEDTDITTHYAEVYDEAGYDIFKSTEGVGVKGRRGASGYTFVERKDHIYGRIPITTMYNNEERMSDLERIESLVDDYDKVLSDVSDEFSVFRNAYLMLKNMVVTEKGKEQLKNEGIIEVMENGDVKFITKQIQTEALENHLDRLEKNIYKFSQVPDLSDENFAGNLSGVAIRFKLFGLETKCIIKERKMTTAINNLFRIISAPLRVTTGKEPDVLNLKLEFTRNVPNNITELVDTVTKLDGKVDKETLLALLPFIDNPREVLEKLKDDIQKEKETTDPYSMQNIQADSNILFPNLNSPQGQLNATGATIPQPQQ